MVSNSAKARAERKGRQWKLGDGRQPLARQTPNPESVVMGGYRSGCPVVQPVSNLALRRGEHIQFNGLNQHHFPGELE
jgi:hypothetical protein